MSTSLHRRLLHAASNAQMMSKPETRMQAVPMPWLPLNVKPVPLLALLLLALAQRVVTVPHPLAKQLLQHQQILMLSILMMTWMSRQFLCPTAYYEYPGRLKSAQLN